MVHSPDESGDFAAIAGAVSINVGTLSGPWVEGMHKAVDACEAHAKPWVLDPVGMGATPFRSAETVRLALRRPTVVRGNASEIKALYAACAERQGGVAGKGVDATHSSAEAVGDAGALARLLGCVVACTGEVDYVTDGTRTAEVHNGSPLQTKVTAAGCSLSSVVAAYLAARPGDPLLATAHAVTAYNMAGDVAAQDQPGPGTFRVRFVDALYEIAEVGGHNIVRGFWDSPEGPVLRLP